MTAAKLTAEDVVRSLRRRYGCETDDGIGPEWAGLDEVDLQPGYSTNRIDLLFIRAWRGKRGHERHAVEVKVSRTDLRRELDRPGKWQPWWLHAHRFYLAVPSSLNLDGLELPPEWGVIEVRDTGATRQVREAPLHEPEPLGDAFLTEVFRRAGRAEARVRGATTDDPAAVIAQLEAEVTRAERARVVARRAEDRARRRADEAMALLACVHPGPPCRCGGTLKPLRKGSIRWEHDGEPGPDEFETRRRGAIAPCTYPRIDTEALAELTLSPDVLDQPEET